MTHDREQREERFRAIAAEVYEPLQRYLGRRAASHDAEELLGDVLLTVWRRLDDVPGDAVLPWCYGVARRAVANHRRAAGRRRNLIERIKAQPPPPPIVDPGGSADHPELAAAFAALNDADREILRLWAWEQLAPREIAVVLDTSANAISLRLSRARKKLAVELQRQEDLSSGQRKGGYTGEADHA